MGTGSHRPQWEAAKGREDVTGGIKHARSLPSHTKLKYRSKPTGTTGTDRHAIEQANPHRLELPTSSQENRSTPESFPKGDNAPTSHSSDSGSDYEDSEEELRRELDLINKRQALLAQRDQKRSPAPVKASGWRSESVFKRPKPTRKRGTDLINDASKKAEHREFLDKYLK